MSQVIKLKKGFNLNLNGEATDGGDELLMADTYAVMPTDYHGISRPKVLVQVGDKVEAGDGVFFDKKLENVIHTAPVSGEVIDVTRGAKRQLLAIVIRPDKKIQYKKFDAFGTKYGEVTREKAIEMLCESGLWTRIIQRPYGVIAHPEEKPRAIFISGFDSHPLAPDYPKTLKEHSAEFASGIEILKKLCSTIHLSERKGQENAEAYAKAQGLQKHVFEGIHPVGNVGVQIHHIDPINKGEMVWTISPQAVVFIGRLFMIGHYDTIRKVALTGELLKKPQYVTLHAGANVSQLLKNNLKDENARVISGNVFTGTNIGKEGHLSSHHDMITVIKEGDYQILFGWIMPTAKPSFHRAFGLLSWLKGKDTKYEVDTNMNGQVRTFVMSGAFEKVIPMDILPTYLFKAILAENYDDMETLGIYEVIEEDVALCEFIDVSKHDLQQILREGLVLLQNS